MRGRWTAGLLAPIALAGCGTPGPTVEQFGNEPTEPVPARAGSVIAEGCTLDTWQNATLASAPARRVLQDVILVCPTLRSTGTVEPADADSQGALAAQINQIRAIGYKVRLAVAMGDDLGTPYSAAEDTTILASATWRTQVVTNLAPFVAMADGLEIDLQKVPSALAPNLTQLVVAIAQAVRPKEPLGIFVPPSTQWPSDVPGGDAYDLASIAPNVDRVRVMTLDFSTGTGGGPTIDSGWAVDALRYNQQRLGTVPIDLAFPLYGTDFGDGGERSVTFLEATAVAEQQGVTPQRGPTGALNYTWQDEYAHWHQTWYDDGVSTVRTLHAWDPVTLPSNVGVVFYGLGAEDPALWDTISRGLP